MPRIIEAIYEDGVFKPFQKVELKNGERVKLRLEDADSIIEDVFGILRGEDTKKALEELENEWGFLLIPLFFSKF